MESGDYLPDLQREGTKEIDIISKAIRLTTIQVIVMKHRFIQLKSVFSKTCSGGYLEEL